MIVSEEKKTMKLKSWYRNQGDNYRVSSVKTKEHVVG